MNLMWRFLWTILFSRFSSTVELFDEGSTNFRVLPTDVDVLLHMNNGRYFSLMDLARINIMIRNKVFYTLKKHKIYPVVASEMIRFRKSLNLFQRFQLSTHILGWDEKFFYIKHHFKYKGVEYAMSLVKACTLRQSGGSVSPMEIMELLGVKNASPPLPSWVNYWLQADQQFYDETMNIKKR